MATEVFVSAGVYTREKDLSWYAASVGQSSLALVGLTTRGRAMYPVKVKNYTDFVDKFGDTNTDYLLPYYAKYYFTNADSAYVVRVLGGTAGGFSNTNAYYLSGSTGEVLGVLRPRHNSGAVTAAVTGAVTVYSSSTSTTDLKVVYSSSTGTRYTSETSFTSSSNKFLSKVFGTSPTDGAHDYLWLDQVFTNNWSGASLDATVSDAAPYVSVAKSDSWITNYSGAGYQNARTPIIKSVPYGGSVHSLFRAYALSDGYDSNNWVKIAIEDIDTTNNTFTIVVRDYSDTDAKKVVLEQWKKLSLDSSSKRYVAKIIGDTPVTGNYDNISSYIYVVMESGVPSSTVPGGFAGMPKLDDKIASSDYKIAMDSSTLVSKQWFGYDFADDDVSRRKYITSAVSSDHGFNLDSGATDIDGTYVSVSMSAISNYTTINAKFLVPMYGGFDGWNIFESTVDITASSGDQIDQFKAGIDLFANPEQYDINLFAVAGAYLGGSIANYAQNMVETRADALYVIDMSTDHTTAAAAVVDADGVDTSYCCTYWPHIKIWDANNEAAVTIPPTAAALEAIAYTDKIAWPWNAAAGFKRGKINCLEAEYILTQEQRDTLYEGKVNPIAEFANDGVYLYGNKTLQDADTALDRIAVRRMLLYIRKIIARASRELVFEQNDSTTWDRFKASVNPILNRVKQRHGLIEFKIEMDENTNTPDLLDRNTMYGKIYLKPTKQAEMIVLDFNIMPQGAVFSE